MSTIQPINNKEFLKRTIKIVEDYKGELEVTLFINACVGLLFIGTEKYKRELKSLSDSTLDSINSTNAIKICRRYKKKQTQFEEEDRTLLNVCRHLRNSIAHCNFEMKKGNHNKVDTITFQDFYGPVGPKDKKDKITFFAEIKMSDFRCLVNRIASFISNL